MRSFFRYVIACVIAVTVVGVSAAETVAQKPRKAKRETTRRGPDGRKRGEVSNGNSERKMLLDRQKAIASAKSSGGMYAGPHYSLPDNKYETGTGRFSMGDYKNKTKSKKAKQKKSKRLIDQDNPNGRMYQQSQNKRNRKLLIF
ncbi:hypothetical protein EFA69_12150 [Rufibacter immobilis]|uniref:Secreted protein n=1 Tax=Rufibacter immobilis TaxID=1348778 RepID=A0A3M9MZC1_9BACT|nr:hypothetical protein [Rufibacter immobilis]RNI30243.1 hypothetical protein EFA69_12150 [Rufibacter immobilis]